MEITNGYEYHKLTDRSFHVYCLSDTTCVIKEEIVEKKDTSAKPFDVCNEDLKNHDASDKAVDEGWRFHLIFKKTITSSYFSFS